MLKPYFLLRWACKAVQRGDWLHSLQHSLNYKYPNTGWGCLQGWDGHLGAVKFSAAPLKLVGACLLVLIGDDYAGLHHELVSPCFVMTDVSEEHGKPLWFSSSPPPSHNLQVSVRDNLAGLSAFGHKGSSGLTYHYQCPACLGSIVQKTHFHLPLTIQKLICKSNGLHLSICPAAVYCVHVGKSTSEAFKWISVLCNARSMNCSN